MHTIRVSNGSELNMISHSSSAVDELAYGWSTDRVMAVNTVCKDGTGKVMGAVVVLNAGRVGLYIPTLDHGVNADSGYKLLIVRDSGGNDVSHLGHQTNVQSV